MTVDIDPAHFTQQLSSALGIFPYTSIHEEKKKHSVAMIYKDWQNAEVIFHTPLRAQKRTEFLEGTVAI